MSKVADSPNLGRHNSCFGRWRALIFGEARANFGPGPTHQKLLGWGQKQNFPATSNMVHRASTKKHENFLSSKNVLRPTKTSPKKIFRRSRFALAIYLAAYGGSALAIITRSLIFFHYTHPTAPSDRYPTRTQRRPPAEHSEAGGTTRTKHGSTYVCRASSI